MNEKIKELMLEATKDMPETYYWPGQYVEKFAELIVRECIGVYNDDGYQTEWEQYQKVLKHFGVKE